MHGIPAGATSLRALTARTAELCRALEDLADADPFEADARLPETRAHGAELVLLLRDAVRAKVPEGCLALLRESAEVLVPIVDGEDPLPGSLPERADAALAPLAHCLDLLSRQLSEGTELSGLSEPEAESAAESDSDSDAANRA